MVGKIKPWLGKSLEKKGYNEKQQAGILSDITKRYGEIVEKEEPELEMAEERLSGF